jgi:hypothetical protein
MRHSVNSDLPEVNTYLPVNGYCRGMLTKPTRKYGSPEGQKKPFKRPVDKNFPERFKKALEHGGYKVGSVYKCEALANKIDATKATFYSNWMKGPTTVDAMLLFAVCDECHVSSRWLLKNEGPMVKISEPDVGQALTNLEWQLTLFPLNKNPEYRHLVESFVKKVRVIGGARKSTLGEISRTREHGKRNPATRTGSKRGGNNRT